MDSLKEKMRLIQDEISSNFWLTQELSIKSLINGVGASKYTIFYRDIINALRFLIGHKNFTYDLAYIPI